MTEKSNHQPAPLLAKSSTLTPYVLIWAGLAFLSLLYLVLLATQPTMVAHYLGAGSEPAQAEATRDQLAHKAIQETAAEVHALRKAVDIVRNELTEMRTQISSQIQTSSALDTRVSTLEKDPATLQRLAKEASAKTAAEAKAAAKAKRIEQAAAEKKAAPAANSGQLETGSVAQPATGAITFGPPTVTHTAVPPAEAAGASLYAVHIATGPSVDSLRLNWTLLNERHSDSFRALEPRYTTDMSGPVQTYDLIVGPLASPDDARRLCQELAMKATPCTVSSFSGDAL